MRRLPLPLFGLAVAVLAAQSPQPGGPARQALLEKVGDFARGYLQHLPDFVCLRITQHYTRKAGSPDWKLQVKIAEELSWFQHSEHYRVVAVNDVPRNKVPRLVMWSGLVTTSGSFGKVVEELFAPESHAAFAWKGTETIARAEAWVFSYRVPRGYTVKSCRGLIIPVCKTSDYPYGGAIYISPDNASILRITVAPENPKPQDAGAHSIDYGRVTIAGSEYLLPVADSYQQVFGKTEIRNEAVYRDYRKFTADSTIRLAPDGR